MCQLTDKGSELRFCSPSVQILTQHVRSGRAAEKSAVAFDGRGQSGQSQAPGCHVELLVLEDRGRHTVTDRTNGPQLSSTARL